MARDRSSLSPRSVLEKDVNGLEKCRSKADTARQPAHGSRCSPIPFPADRVIAATVRVAIGVAIRSSVSETACRARLRRNPIPTRGQPDDTDRQSVREETSDHCIRPLVSKVVTCRHAYSGT
jgi:hypothetical protein